MTAGLFGLSNSNKDFSNEESWGKNQFNNAFPVALCCYMAQKNVKPVYLTLKSDTKTKHELIPVSDVFNIKPDAKEAFFAFESVFNPYEPMVGGRLPRIDLVVDRREGKKVDRLKGLEIKLTALPDNTTSEDDEANWGSEIVVRPDTIVYLALSIATVYAKERDELLSILTPVADKIKVWKSTANVGPHLNEACEAIDEVLVNKIEEQSPLMIQPIWKTEGKKLILKDNCLDAFVWSDFALTRLFVDSVKGYAFNDSIGRHARTVMWLTRMLYDFAKKGKMSPQVVIDHMTYDTKNDKAFASGGVVTRSYMKCEQIMAPRIKKSEVKKIILGGGEKFLSPERRFDAAVLSTPNLFVE